MNTVGTKVCAYLAMVAGTLMFLAVWPLMHIFPPFEPAMATSRLANIYRDNATSFITGGMFIVAASVLFMPFCGVIATLMKKIEGEHSPLTWAFIAMSGFTFCTVMICGLLFAYAAYRPDASDELIRAFSDLAIVMLIVPGLAFCGMTGMFGASILTDNRRVPIVPRWIGYLQIFATVLTLPAGVVMLFKSGPFAWNGALGYWVPTFGFGVWMCATFWAVLDAAKRNALAGE